MNVNWKIVYAYIKTFRRPSILVLESTNDCNANCTMCSRVHLNRDIGTMDFKLFRKIIGEAKIHNIDFFQLSFYGESLIDPLLIQKIQYIKDQIPEAWTQIITNGRLLTRECSKKLIDISISEIRVSIEGNNKEEYEHTRRGLDFNTLIENMLFLKGYRDAMTDSSTLITVTGLSLKTRVLNKTEYEQFWKDYCDKVFTQDEHIIKLEKRENILQKILPCPRLFTMLPILSSGECTICITDWYGEMIYSNLYSKSISQTWFTPRLIFYKIRHLIGLKKTIKFCKKCSYRPDYSKIMKTI